MPKSSQTLRLKPAKPAKPSKRPLPRADKPELTPEQQAAAVKMAHAFAALVLATYDRACAAFRAEPLKVGAWGELTEASMALEFICGPDAMQWCMDNLAGVGIADILPRICNEARARAVALANQGA